MVCKTKNLFNLANTMKLHKKLNLITLKRMCFFL